jgi:toxin ParE1/3/4
VKRKLLIAPAALADLQAIWDYGVQNWSVVQAQQYVKGLDQVFSLLCDQPLLARLRQEFTPPLRLYRYQSHVVAFVADHDSLTVLRVMHGRSSWAELLVE